MARGREIQQVVGAPQNWVVEGLEYSTGRQCGFIHENTVGHLRRSLDTLE